MQAQKRESHRVYFIFVNESIQKTCIFFLIRRDFHVNILPAAPADTTVVFGRDFDGLASTMDYTAAPVLQPYISQVMPQYSRATLLKADNRAWAVFTMHLGTPVMSLAEHILPLCTEECKLYSKYVKIDKRLHLAISRTATIPPQRPHVTKVLRHHCPKKRKETENKRNLRLFWSFTGWCHRTLDTNRFMHQHP